jgi:hypothetical protein
MSAKCPKCEAILSSVKIETLDVGPKRLRGVAYCCTSCSTVLSVELDPLALQHETIKAIKGR